MAQYSILGSASDGYMGTDNSTVYSTVRDAAAGNINVSDFDALNIYPGQTFFLHFPYYEYQIYRGYLFFDCSGVSGDISNAALDLWFSKWNKEKVSSLIVQGGMPDYPHDPVVLGDYNRDHYSGTLAQIMAPLEDVPVKIRTFLTADGIAAINKGGWTKFCLRSEGDVNGVPPNSLFETASFYSNEKGIVSGTDYRPYLEINPTLPSAGYIWTHNNLLRWTDEVFTVRGILGEDTTVNATAGYLWVEGTYVHYISQNGDERRQQGITTGDTGTPSQMWIQSVMLHYIDASGDERVLGTWFLDEAHLDADTVIG